jgi:hypothetical protein
MGAAALAVLVTAAHYFATGKAGASSCYPTAMPPDVGRRIGSCAPGCDGQLYMRKSGGTFCFIPSHVDF